MFQAIVFLPLLGAIIGAVIALAGARARFPGEGPPPPSADDHDSHAGASAAHGRGAGVRHSHDEHGGPAAAGSRTVELITTTLLMISMILSWIAFVQVGFGHQDVRVPIFTWLRREI